MLQNELLDDQVKVNTDFKEFDFPITFEFKLGTMANDFVAKDSSGNTLAYVRQKMFKLKEAISVYSEESKSNLLYTIAADRIIDFNASYEFKNADEKVLGSVGRKGMKSLWKAHYEIFDIEKNQNFHINEENPWSKVFDTLLCQIPLVGVFSGLMFNPKYGIIGQDGTIIARLSKEKSLFGRTFKLEKLANFKEGDSERLMLALMMMLLLERRRG